MADKPVCPIKGKVCIEEKCAWWVRDQYVTCCAIKTIATAISKISKNKR